MKKIHKGILFGLILCLPFLWMGSALAKNCGDGVDACACGDTLTASYTLTGNLNCTNAGNGLNIGAADITLDLAGYTIDGDDTNTVYGVYNNAHNGVTITSSNGNGIIQEFTTNNLFLEDSDSNVISNITSFDGGDNGGIKLHGSDSNSFTNCIAHGGDNSGFVLEADSDLNTFTSCEAYSNTKVGVGDGDGFTIGNDPGANNGNTLTKCSIHDNVGNGIGFFLSGGNIIEYCKIYSNEDGVGIAEDSDSNIFRYNEIYSNSAMGIYAYDSSSTEIYNNLFYSQGANHLGLGDADTALGTTKIYNNVFYTGSGDKKVKIEDCLSGSVDIINNIFINQDGANLWFIDSDDAGTIDYNLYDRSGSTCVIYTGACKTPGVGGTAFSSFGWEEHGMDADPLFTNAAGGDFWLKNNSPACRGGTYLSGYTTKLKWGEDFSDLTNIKTIEDALSIGAYACPKGSALLGF